MGEMLDLGTLGACVDTKTGLFSGTGTRPFTLSSSEMARKLFSRCDAERSV